MGTRDDLVRSRSAALDHFGRKHSTALVWTPYLVRLLVIVLPVSLAYYGGSWLWAHRPELGMPSLVILFGSLLCFIVAIGCVVALVRSWVGIGYRRHSRWLKRY